jgi:hypothetical protein
VENTRLKKLLAEAELDKAMLKEIAEDTSDPEPSPPRRSDAAHRSTQRLNPPVVCEEEQRLRAWLRALSKARSRGAGGAPRSRLGGRAGR